MPVLVDEYVRAGKLRIVFHGLAFLGPDSVTALDTALAAGRDGKLFDVVHALFANQGRENAGWVTDELLDGIVRDAGLDPERLRAGASSAWVERAKVEADAAARHAGVRGTPSFELGRTGGELSLVQLESLGPEGLTTRSSQSERTRAAAWRRRRALALSLTSSRPTSSPSRSL